MISLYDVLEVSQNASQEVIKGSYKALCKKYHPDIYKGNDAENKIKQINHAYDILSDTEKRKNYDILLGIGQFKDSSNENDSYKKADDLNSESVNDSNDFKSDKTVVLNKKIIKAIGVVATAVLSIVVVFYFFSLVNVDCSPAFRNVIKENKGNYYALLDLNGDYKDELIIRKSTKKLYSEKSDKIPRPGIIYEIYTNIEDAWACPVGYFEIPAGCLIYLNDTNELFLYSHGEISDCKEHGSYYLNEKPIKDTITKLVLWGDDLILDKEEYATMVTRNVDDAYDQYKNPDKYELLKFLNKYYYTEDSYVLEFVEI